MWRAETSLHHSPAVTALCSHSQYFILFVSSPVFCFFLPQHFWPIVPLWLHSPFCCLLSPVLMCTFLLPPFLVSSSSSTPSLIVTFPSPLSSLLFLLHHLLSSFLFIIFLSPLVVTGEQLALLQYRLSMSSMPCQPHAPPGSGTLHTYQVLLPFHSPPPLWGLLEVNLNQ